MAAHGTDQVFSGSIPELYDTLLVPLIFRPMRWTWLHGRRHVSRSAYWKLRQVPEP